MRTIAAAATLLLWASAAVARPVVSKVTMAGNDAGSQTVERTARDDRRPLRVHRPRRGPKLEATYRLNEEGLPVAVEIDGNEYMKAAVAERFALDAGRASWKNRGEQGEEIAGTAAGGAFY